MSTDNWMGLVQTLSVLLAITVAVSSLRLRSDERASALAKMQTDIEHIKKAVDKIGAIREELTEARADIKAESRRMDEHLKGGVGEGERWALPRPARGRDASAKLTVHHECPLTPTK